MRLGRIGDRLIRALLVFSVALAAFSYGIATVHYRIFPYRTLCEAKLAWDAVKAVYGRERAAGDPAGEAESSDGLASAPLVRRHAEDAGEEWLLVSGGPGYLRSHSAAEGCLAWVMDRQGTVRHLWRYDATIWRDLQNVHRVPGFSMIYPVDVHLCSDGGLLVSFQGENCFPFAVGLARLDAHGRLLWKRELVHHWFSVGTDGRIYAPAVQILDSPIGFKQMRPAIASPKGKILSDTIEILNSRGNLLDEIDVLHALVESGWVGLFHSVMAEGANPLADAITDDPIHLNDVRVVEAVPGKAPAWLATGDLLVSMRSINAVGVLDGRTRAAKWLAVGRTLRQHSPRLVEGGVVVFDNLGGGIAPGGSRIVRLDLFTQGSETLFPVAANPLPGPFFTETAGHLDLHRDGRRALVAVARQGRIWEIDLSGGRLLWEYVLGEQSEHGRPKPLYTAKYVNPASVCFVKGNPP